MMKLTKILEEIDSDAQTLIDILSMYPHESPMFKKYYTMLKKDYGIDYFKVDKDDEYIKTANLDDIKVKKDFLNWDKYRKYAKEILRKRGISNEMGYSSNRGIDFETAKKHIESFGLSVKYRKYSGSGNYAGYQSGKIFVSDEIDLATLIHELGHAYDDKVYKKGISQIMTNASTGYGTLSSDECFADNFMYYFMNPSGLKSKIPEVYNDLNKRINGKWKSAITKIMKSK